MMNVASALNEVYVPYTYVMLYSLFENNRSDRICVYLLQQDLSAESKRLLEALADSYGGSVVIPQMDMEAFDARLLSSHEWSMETCFRLQLLDLLPETVDRLIYLDGDMIINRDISELYHMDFQGKHLIVCHDMTMTPDSEPVYGHLHTEVFNRMIRENRYFNAGMIVMDVAWLRAHYSFRDYLEHAEKLHYEIFAPDQDLLNYTHQGETLYVDEWKYDLFACNAFVRGYDHEKVKEQVSIIHYVGEKPWNSGDHFHYDVEKLWWDYALKTEFAAQFVRNFVNMALDKEAAFYMNAKELERQNAELQKGLGEVLDAYRKLAKLKQTEVQEALAEPVDVPEPFLNPAENIFRAEGETPTFVQRMLEDGTMKAQIEARLEANRVLRERFDAALKAFQELAG